jgi:ComF family protein
MTAFSLLPLAKTIYQKLVDFILPPRCGLCGEIVADNGALCAACWHKLTFISAPYCVCCGTPFAYKTPASTPHEQFSCTSCLTDPKPYSLARAPILYGQEMARLVGRFKYQAQTWLLPVFVPWLQRVSDEVMTGADLVVPVPLHRWRLLWRGYNQATLLAAQIAQSYTLPCLPHALKRLKYTRPQVGLEREKRLKNVKTAFSADPTLVGNKIVVLVDDVMTTGATINACAIALQKAGAKEVRVLTLARVAQIE